MVQKIFFDEADQLWKAQVDTSTMGEYSFYVWAETPEGSTAVSTKMTVNIGYNCSFDEAKHNTFFKYGNESYP